MKKASLQNIGKIAVGLSGGVDSAVVAYLLKDAGLDVTGVHLQCWDYDAKGCTGKRDRADAVEVATQLGIQFLSLDFQNEYKRKVLDYFFCEYKAGRTPNPDVLCNREVKFGLFLNWALDNGFSHIATGHYASIKKNTFYDLRMPEDTSKDQTYFLYQLGQKELSHVIFPLGQYLKREVREIALKQNLPVAQKPESFGVCFIGDINLTDFLVTNAGFNLTQGIVRDTHGSIIGTHNGAYAFTIGQRHGFTVTKYQGRPLYVLQKDVIANELIVGDYEDCLLDKFNLTNVHWIAERFISNLECDCRIRHLGQLYSCRFNPTTLEVNLVQKAFGVASGQSAVFYQDGRVLGGGIIS